ncbi:hypothetical protein D3C73_1236890 [compost metagenome]
MLVAFVAGVTDGLEQVFVEVLPVRQLGAVELFVDPRLDLLGQEVVGRHDHVIAGLARQQLGFQGFVAVEDVVLDLDACLFFELRDGVRSDVIGPVVDVQHLVFSLNSGGHGTHQGGGQQRLAHFLHASCSRIFYLAICSAARTYRAERRATETAASLASYKALFQGNHPLVTT